MENEEEKKEEKEEDKDLKNLKESMEAIDKMTTLDIYRWLLASYTDNRAYRKEMKKEKEKEKEKSDSLVKRIMNKFKTTKDAAIEEKESNDKPEK